jgi:hypothetical protein
MPEGGRRVVGGGMTARWGSRPGLLAVSLLGLWFGGVPAPGQNDPESSVAREPVALGSIRVDAATRTLLATGWVNQVEDAIEVLACGPGGKTHESVFVLSVHPLDLQTGFLLLGLKPGRPLPMLGVGPPEGPAVDIWVEWEENGSRRRERAEHFVFSIESESRLPDTHWIFTGSTFEGGEFKALHEETLIATYWDPWAILNIPLPCGSNDEVLVVNRELAPALGTPITMSFRPRPAEAGHE